MLEQSRPAEFQWNGWPNARGKNPVYEALAIDLNSFPPYWIDHKEHFKNDDGSIAYVCHPYGDVNDPKGQRDFELLRLKGFDVQVFKESAYSEDATEIRITPPAEKLDFQPGDRINVFGGCEVKPELIAREKVEADALAGKFWNFLPREVAYCLPNLYVIVTEKPARFGKELVPHGFYDAKEGIYLKRPEDQIEIALTERLPIYLDWAEEAVQNRFGAGFPAGDSCLRTFEELRKQMRGKTSIAPYRLRDWLVSERRVVEKHLIVPA